MQISSSIQSRLQFQHQTVTELVKGHHEDQLKVHPIVGKWSAFENIVHLVVYQPVFLDRLEQILAGTTPSFQRYIADTDPVFLAALKKPMAEHLVNLQDVRDTIRKRIQEATANELSLTGVHPKFGNLTLVEWTEFFLLHEAHHLFTIFQLLRTMG